MPTLTHLNGWRFLGVWVGVLISSNQLQLNCSSDWFELIWTGFFVVQSGFFSSYLIRQLVAVTVASKKGKKPDLTRFLNTRSDSDSEEEDILS